MGNYQLLSAGNWRRIVGMGFVTAALCGLVFGQQAPAPQKIWQGFGVNVHFTEPAPAEINLLRASGVDYIRTDFNWELTERSAGKYDFGTYDRLVGQLKVAHIRPMFVLAYGNKLYENGAPKSPKAQSAYANWVEAVVSHFRGEEIVWEIWNEPNTDNSWKPKADANSYASLALRAARAMRATDPTCRIIAPGTSRIDEEFLKKVLTPELLGLIDGVSVHPYRASGPETVVKDYERIQAIIQAKAPPGRENLPVVCSEWGYSTATNTGVNEDRQAMYLDKLWLLSAAAGSPVSIYYGWKDEGTNPNNSEHRYGIVRSNLSPKPAFDAARLCLKAFKGCTIYRRMQKTDPLDWVIIGVGDGRMVRAMWYQKVGGLPRFEAYDMTDKANRTLYNQIIADSKVGATIPDRPIDPPKKDPPKKDPPKKDPPKKDPPKKDPPKIDPPKKDPPKRDPIITTRTALNIAFAPPIDSEGWCAIIQKPSSMANAKVEFRYDRKENGAAVTCFTNVKTERVIEPLANNDADSNILSLVGGKAIGSCQIKRVDLDPAMWVLKMGSTKEQLTKSQMGASVDYAFSDRVLKGGLVPTSSIAIPEGAKRFVIWIKPDGSYNNLFARFKDENGTIFQVFLGNLDSNTDRNGWRAVEVPFVNLPSETISTGGSVPKGRLEWESILTVEAADKNQPKSGKIEFGPAAYEF